MNSIIKTYDIINQNTFRAKHFEVRQNGMPILWINTKSEFFGPPQINIQTQSSTGPIVAAAKLKTMSSGCRVIVGNPDATSKEQWSDVASESFTGKAFGFSCGGRRFMWKRWVRLFPPSRRIDEMSFMYDLRHISLVQQNGSFACSFGTMVHWQSTSCLHHEIRKIYVRFVVEPPLPFLLPLPN